MIEQWFCTKTPNFFANPKTMSFSSIRRFLINSVSSNSRKSSTLHFSTASSAEKFYSLLQKKGRNIEKTLATVRDELDSSCVTEVLQRCSLHESEVGFRFFVWAGLQSKYRHSSLMYGKACELLNIRTNPSVVSDVIEAYGSEGCLVSGKTFKVVLNLCKQAKLHDEALWVLRKMADFNVRPDSVTYNVIIRLFCEKGDMDMAEMLMREMGLIGLFPDVITHIAMIKGFCDVGQLDDACRIFGMMRVHGCSPNTIAYSALLDGICQFGSMERAMVLLGEMEKEGGDCCPNVVTYTSVIQRFCEKGRTMEALGILDRMQSRGYAPNVVTVRILINSLCSEEKLREAYELIDSVVAGGSVSYSESYSSLVISLTRQGKFPEAEKVFRQMLASGLKPDGMACSVVIRELCEKGRVVDGFVLYDEIQKQGCCSVIDSDIYSTLLFGLCQEGHKAEAAKLARSMLEKGIRVKGSYADKIAEHLNKSGDENLGAKFSLGGR